MAPAAPARPTTPVSIRKEWSERYSSARYDELPWFSPRPYPWVAKAVEESWWIRGTRILDVGCGAGTNSLFLARAGFKVTGIDLAEGAIEAATRRARRAGLKVDFRVGDALDLPFPEAYFGGAIDIGCYHTLPIPLRRPYSEELARVVHPRRSFALSWAARESGSSFGPPHRPSVEETTRAFEEDFLFLRTEYLPSYDGRPHKGGLSVYNARLGRRSKPRPPEV